MPRAISSRRLLAGKPANTTSIKGLEATSAICVKSFTESYGSFGNSVALMAWAEISCRKSV
ncbi:MAG: hypothetical protein A3H35_17940 [Betaproteobacteria bacterium RIFCSPLOWO2_02_FULL_62_17]|nr:MAG: hypothetical protein A3H35_17940 [Betaproteobacteria bacterium RIFCSPLOWO2_02_FULL_62_17]